MPTLSKLLVTLAVADGFQKPSSIRQATKLSALTTPDMVSIYGRLSESTCVAEDGETTQTAKKPKWIPAYSFRKDHVPTWMEVFAGKDRCPVAYIWGSAAVSRHLHESSPGEKAVGGFFFDFGAVRTATVPSTHRQGKH